MRAASLSPAFHPLNLRFTPPNNAHTPIRVSSHRVSGVAYTLDLAAQTCTCPDFRETRRKTINPGELGRLCKHLVRALAERQAFDGASKWVNVIVQEGYGAPYFAWEVALPTAKPMLVTITDSRDWINVYAHLKRAGERYPAASGPVQQFGWSRLEHRWSYGEGPPGASEIRSLLKQLDFVDLDSLLHGTNQSEPPHYSMRCVVGQPPSGLYAPLPDLSKIHIKPLKTGSANKSRGLFGRLFLWLK